MRRWTSRWLYLALLAVGASVAATVRAESPKPARGYFGLSYHGDEKVTLVPAGGLATYGPQHGPVAVHSARARQTFFVFSGSPDPQQPGRMQTVIGSYDHKAGKLGVPVVLAESEALPQAGASLALDGDGRLWVFMPSIKAGEPGRILRASETDALAPAGFEQVTTLPFEAPNAWYVEGKGFVLVFERAADGRRELCATTSPDGKTWSEPALLASIQDGCSAVTWRYKGKIGVALNYRRTGGGLPTGVYYIETPDAGKTWVTLDRQPAPLPLKTENSTALVFDYHSTGQSVFLKDLNFDSMGNPTILYLVTRANPNQPPAPPFIWTTARWLARGWRITGLIQSDNMMDCGVLHFENRSDWRVVAPTDAGAEPNAPGGEVVQWWSDDFGRAWAPLRLTHDSHFNHNFIRRAVDGQPDFYTFWADGAVAIASESRLYFSTREGKVYRMPRDMSGGEGQPELVAEPPAQSQPNKITE